MRGYSECWRPAHFSNEKIVFQSFFMSTTVHLLMAAASSAWPKPDVFVPPPDLSIIHGGGADYPEIGSVLLEAAVEAGITVAVVTIHRAQH